MILNPSTNGNPGNGVNGLVNLTFAEAEEKWQAAASSGVRKSMSGLVRQISGADMNNDGVVDVVVAYGGVENNSSAVSGVQVLFGSAATQSNGDFANVSPTNVSNAPHPVLSMQAQTQIEATLLLLRECRSKHFCFVPWQVADVDGDGWMDIATSFDNTAWTSFDNTAAAHHKTIYYGKRSAAGLVRYENTSWPDTVGSRFGPPAQDAWQISSLELIDLNLDGNLDLFYCAEGQLPHTAVGNSIAVRFDEAAKAHLKSTFASMNFTAGVAGASITSVAVSVNNALAGTANSECRNPADDVYPVQTRIGIDFPMLPCTKENFKDCILLDQITALASTVDNAANQGVVMCSYTVDLHRDTLPLPPPPPPSPPPPSPPPSPPPPSSPPPPCDPTAGPVDRGFKLNFGESAGASITHNNLGGVGPDTGDESIKFSNVGTVAGEQIDMVVKINTEDPDTNYLNHLTDGNQSNWDRDPQNKLNGNFSQINIKADHQAEVEFCFYSGGQQFKLDVFSFTFHGFGDSPFLYPSAPLVSCFSQPYRCHRRGASLAHPPHAALVRRSRSN